VGYPSPDELAAAGLRLDVADAMVTVTLDRPDVRNAQTPAMWRALAAIGDAIESGTRVVVLRAEGPSFSAGLDRRMFTAEGIPGEPTVAEIAAMSDADADGVIAGFQGAFTWWRRADAVTVAAVRGHAVGAGFQLALACDLRVLAEDAQLAMPETTLGLVPDLAGTQPLVELVGYPRALEICATGRVLDAGEAAELGLATAVVPAAELDATVADLAAALTMPPPGAVTATKALLRSAGQPPDEQTRAERTAQIARLRELLAASRP